MYTFRNEEHGDKYYQRTVVITDFRNSLKKTIEQCKAAWIKDALSKTRMI